MNRLIKTAVSFSALLALSLLWGTNPAAAQVSVGSASRGGPGVQNNALPPAGTARPQSRGLTRVNPTLWNQRLDSQRVRLDTQRVRDAEDRIRAKEEAIKDLQDQASRRHRDAENAIRRHIEAIGRSTGGLLEWPPR
jgi:hypothetical protein